MSIDRIPTQASASLLAEPKLENAQSEPQFNVVARGFHRDEVTEWVDWARQEISRLGGEVDRLGHLAAGAVKREISSPEGQQMLADLIKMAADEALGMKSQAAEEAAQAIAAAKEQAQTILDDARKQADQKITSATQQAASLVEGARQEAKRTTDNATAHAVAVHEAAEARLAHAVAVHQDTIARLDQISDVTTKYVAADRQRGSLADEVSRALAPIQPPARPAASPQQQTARPY